MNTAPLNKLSTRTAAEVCARFQMSSEAKKLLKDGDAPARLLEALVAAGHWPEAVKLLTHLMSKREAVAWAADSAREALPEEADPKALAALKAADAWVKDPSEENRRAAQAASEQAGLEHPSASAALAAFFSGGSLAPAHVPAVPPGEYLTAHAAACAVMAAAVASEPQKAPQKYERFIAHGLEIIGKIEPAKPAAAAAAPPQPATAPPAAPTGSRTMGALYGNARSQGR